MAADCLLVIVFCRAPAGSLRRPERPLALSSFSPFLAAWQIAYKELEKKMIPFTIRRFLPDGSFEDWAVKDLIIEDRDKRR